MYAPPWIEPGQTKLEDVGPELVNSFAKGVQQNIQQQQVKEQLQRLDLAIQEHQDMAKYRDQEIALRKAALSQSADLRSRALDDAETRMGLKYDDLKQGRTEFMNIAKGLAAIDPNADDAEAQFYNLIGDNPYGAMSTGGRRAQQDWWRGRNQNARVKGSALRADYSVWEKDLRNSLGGGYPVDASILLDANKWQPQYEIPGVEGTTGPQTWDPNQSKLVPTSSIKGAKATGNVYIDTGIPDKNNPGKNVFITRPKTFIDNKISEYADFQKRFQSPALRQRTLPSLDVFPESPTDDPNAPAATPRPVYTDANGNKAYKNPDGSFSPIQ